MSCLGSILQNIYTHTKKTKTQATYRLTAECGCVRGRINTITLLLITVVNRPNVMGWESKASKRVTAVTLTAGRRRQFELPEREARKKAEDNHIVSP